MYFVSKTINYYIIKLYIKLLSVTLFFLWSVKENNYFSIILLQEELYPKCINSNHCNEINFVNTCIFFIFSTLLGSCLQTIK